MKKIPKQGFFNLIPLILVVAIITAIDVYFVLQKGNMIGKIQLSGNSNTTNEISSNMENNENTINLLSEESESNSQNQESMCGIELIVIGGAFSPQLCEFQVVTPGVPCGANADCSVDYRLVLKDTIPSHIKEIAFLNLKQEGGTYFFDDFRKDFHGRLLDEAARLRNLLKAEIYMEPQDQRVKVVIDAIFANNISIKGSGMLPISFQYGE